MKLLPQSLCSRLNWHNWTYGKTYYDKDIYCMWCKKPKYPNAKYPDEYPDATQHKEQRNG